jgi:hypothetical protein
MLLAPRVLGAQMRAPTGHRPPPRSQVQCSGGQEMQAGRPKCRRVVALPLCLEFERRDVAFGWIEKNPDLSGTSRRSARF